MVLLIGLDFGWFQDKWISVGFSLDNRSIKNVLDVNGSFDRFGFRTVSRTKGLWYSSG
jgi:hypothetical protein